MLNVAYLHQVLHLQFVKIRIFANYGVFISHARLTPSFSFPILIQLFVIRLKLLILFHSLHF